MWVNSSLNIQLLRQTGVTSMFNVVTLANFLCEAGHKVDITCIEPATESVSGLHDEITVVGLGAGRGVGWRKLMCRFSGAYRLRQHLGKRKFDLLYVLDSWTLPTLSLATAGKLRWPGVKLVYHTYDWLEPSVVSAFHRRLEKVGCLKADLVVNTDRSRARMQQSIYGLKSRPIWVQNCLSKMLPIPPLNEALRREMAGTDETANLRIMIYPTVVSNAESSQRMAWELIQAFRMLPRNYRLVLFFREGVEYHRCITACAEASISDRVKFMAPMNFLRLLGYVASADIGAIFYDDRQSSGYFMCNADKLSLLAACGIPFVASDQPNLESIVYRHRLGECCDPTDSLALANAIQLVADGEMPLAQRKKQVRDAFLQHLNFELHGRRLLIALNNLY